MVIKFEQTDSTIIHLAISNYGEDVFKYTINAPDNSTRFALHDSNSDIEYKFFGLNGNANSDKSFVLYPNRIDTIKLYFERTPRLRTFDLIAGEKDKYWDFRGIDPTKTNEGMMNRMVGRRVFFRHQEVHQVNLFFSERYNFVYEGLVEEYKNKFFKIKIDNGILQDPKLASVNYLQNRSRYSRLIQGNIGEIVEYSPTLVFVEIW